MKLFYVTRDIQPNEDMHFVLSGGAPDLVTLLAPKGMVVTEGFAKSVRKFHGTSHVASVEFDGVFSEFYRENFKQVSDGNVLTRFYIPAL
jgi:hypothetical protein